MTEPRHDYQPTDNSTLKRSPARGRYDRATVHAILDSARICHVGFNVGQQPFVLPTAFGRDGERIYLHGASSGRMMRVVGGSVPVCVTVTHLDGLVLARSWFHHSFNFRSVVIFGNASPIDEPERKLHALRCLVEHVAPGRAAATRPPDARELKATRVLELQLCDVSAKVRTGGPIDDPADLSQPAWAGHVPLVEQAGVPVPAADLHHDPGFDENVLGAAQPCQR